MFDCCSSTVFLICFWLNYKRSIEVIVAICDIVCTYSTCIDQCLTISLIFELIVRESVIAHHTHMSTMLSSSATSMTSNSFMMMTNHKQRISSSLSPSTSLPKYFTVPFAIQHGYFHCVRYLLQLSYDPNEHDHQFRTPLVLCAFVQDDRWSVFLAQNLLEKGAKIALDDHTKRNAYDAVCLPMLNIRLRSCWLTFDCLS
jgi:hypothetical protein